MEQAKLGDTVRVHYTGKLEDGTVFDSSHGRNALEFTLGTDHLMQGFHQAVLGMKAGESKEERISSEHAYGPYEEARCITVDRAMFLSEGVTPKTDMQLEVRGPDGENIPVRIADVSD